MKKKWQIIQEINKDVFDHNKIFDIKPIKSEFIFMELEKDKEKKEKKFEFETDEDWK